MSNRDLGLARGLANGMVSLPAEMLDSIAGGSRERYQAAFVERMVRQFKEEGKGYEQVADWVIDYYGNPETCADIFAYVDEIWNQI